MENFLKLIASLQEIVAKMEAQSADFPAQLEAVRVEAFEAGKVSRDEEFAALVVSKDQEKVDFGAAEYARGFADGGAGAVSDKIYSQAELDAAVASATGPLNEQVSLLQGRIVELEGIVAGFDAKVQEAVSVAIAQVKADLLAKFDATQVDDNEFRESLK